MDLPILGAIIAGGTSRRFGRDKAAELVGGRALIDGVLNALTQQVDEVVICGREWSSLKNLQDRPAPNLGPLGGINAALHYASRHGFEGAFCMPVDIYPAPENILKLLAGEQLGGEQLAVLKDQHMIGYWPAHLAMALEAYLLSGERKVHGFLDQVDARRIPDPPGLTNVNHPHDLKRL